MGSIRKVAIKLASGLIPVRQWRKDFRHYFLGDSKQSEAPVHPTYGHIYPPIYNMSADFMDGYPDIYNAAGRKMEMFFLRDEYLAQCSEKDYLSRLNAIKDNYRRVMSYLHIEDWLYEHYLAPEAKGLSQRGIII